MDGDISAAIVNSSYGVFDRYRRSSQSVKLTINGKEYTIRLYRENEVGSKSGRKILNISELGSVLRLYGTSSVHPSLGDREYTHLNAKDFKRFQKVLTEQLRSSPIGSSTQAKVGRVALATLKLNEKPLAEGSFNAVMTVNDYSVDTKSQGDSRVRDLGSKLIFRQPHVLNQKKIAKEDSEQATRQLEKESRIIEIATKGLKREQCYQHGVEPPGVEVTYKGRNGTLKEQFAGSLDDALKLNEPNREGGESSSVTKQRFSSIVEGASFLFNRGIALLDVKCENMLVKGGITVHTDIGESTIGDLYDKMRGLSPDKIRRAVTPLGAVGEPQTPHLMNSKFEGRLVGAITNKDKEAFTKVLNQYVTYKTAIELVTMSSPSLYSWADSIYEPEARIPDAIDFRRLKEVVGKLPEVSNEYFTTEQVKGLKSIINNGCSEIQQEVGFDMEYLKSLFPSGSPSQ